MSFLSLHVFVVEEHEIHYNDNGLIIDYCEVIFKIVMDSDFIVF